MKLNTTVITLIAASSIFAAITYNGMFMAHASESKKTSTTVPITDQESAKQSKALSGSIINLQQVSVQTTRSASYQATVVGFGEAHAQYELDYSSEVSGRVKKLAEHFKTGYILKKGAVLATLDNTSYQQVLAQAKADVASANLALLEEQREGVQARSEWQRSGLVGDPDSSLVLREPQLANVKAALENALQSLNKAQKDLNDTIIRAPFDALVVSREIQPGSYLQAGDSVATLYSVDRIEVEIPLSDKQWENLPSWNNNSNKQWSVTLQSSNGHEQWQGRIERIEQHLSEERQRSLIVVVDKPLAQASQLYPGSFVEATIAGTQMDNLWELPASAISQQGELWTIDSQGELQKNSATKLFENEDKVYVLADQECAVQVVKRPISNFQVGMQVLANEEG